MRVSQKESSERGRGDSAHGCMTTGTRYRRTSEARNCTVCVHYMYVHTFTETHMHTHMHTRTKVKHAEAWSAYKYVQVGIVL